MTEIPEHLLKRSKQARQKATGVVDETVADAPQAAPTESANAPAVVGDAAPQVKAPVPLPEVDAPPPPPPEDPWVTLAKDRQKIPVWVMPILLFLPIWLILYVGTLEAPDQEEGVLFEGGEIYAEHCASCHGNGGGGGIGPAFTNGAIHETFNDVEAQVAWVVHGTAGYQAAGIATYGDQDTPVGDGGAQMPAFGDTLTAEELILAVMFERVELGGDTDPSEFELADLVYEMLESGELDGEAHFLEGSEGDLTGRGEIATYFTEARQALGGEEVAGG